MTGMMTGWQRMDLMNGAKEDIMVEPPLELIVLTMVKKVVETNDQNDDQQSFEMSNILRGQDFSWIFFAQKTRDSRQNQIAAKQRESCFMEVYGKRKCTFSDYTPKLRANCSIFCVDDPRHFGKYANEK